MKQLNYILLLFVCLASYAKAEIVVLQSGVTIEGEILLQNDDIIMVQTKDGRKFQYPRKEVVEIKPSEQVIENKPSTTTTSGKGNCALRLDFGGGGLFVPTLQNGGYGSVDLQIGSRRIGQQRVFLGGSVGYQAAVAGKAYHFIPFMAVFSMPLLPGKHAPEIGAGLGYGLAVKNPAKGGMVAKLDMSWRYQFSPSSALLLGVQTRWQQADVKFTEVIEEDTYSSTLGKSFVSVGLRLALEF